LSIIGDKRRLSNPTPAVEHRRREPLSLPPQPTFEAGQNKRRLGGWGNASRATGSGAARPLAAQPTDDYDC